MIGKSFDLYATQTTHRAPMFPLPDDNRSTEPYAVDFGLSLHRVDADPASAAACCGYSSSNMFTNLYAKTMLASFFKRFKKSKPIKVSTEPIEVSISSTDTHIFSEIAGTAGDNFAFYVYRNDVEIHTQWYSKANSLQFDHGGIPAVYRVMGFIKNDKDEMVSKSSRDCIVFGRKIKTRDIEVSADRPFIARAGKHDFHCLFYPSQEKRLFVLLTAAVTRPHPLPAFSRWTWRDRFPGSVLCISDPTLPQSETLGIGWYLGTEKRDATSDMAELVQHIAGLLGVAGENIIPYGSSAGGFAAMALATRIPGALAVAINPQTDATRYDQQRVAEMMEHCFPRRTLEEVRQRYPSRVNMVSAIPESQARVIIAQNTEDHDHWEPHFIPFAAVTGVPHQTGSSPDGRHASIVYSHGSGHAAEPPEIFERVMALIQNLPNHSAGARSVEGAGAPTNV